MPWQDLHLEIYQREPAVCPRKHKNREDLKKREKKIQMTGGAREQIAAVSPAYAAGGDCQDCGASYS